MQIILKREKIMNKVKEFISKNAKYLIFLLLAGIVGGIFAGIYTLEITDPALLEEALAEIGGKAAFIAVYVVQIIGYALFCGIVGKISASKIGLWRELRFEGKSCVVAAVSGLGVGAAMMALELLWFSNVSEVIKSSYDVPPTISNFIASLIYGGIIEELMLRLFLMSLIALVLRKVFFKSEENVSAKALVIANVLSALLFAAGHIPATVMSIGITPIILIRCFLLNGGAGLVFGRLYRKRGIQYAMIAHAFAHIAMKLIWLIIAL